MEQNFIFIFGTKLKDIVSIHKQSKGHVQVISPALLFNKRKCFYSIFLAKFLHKKHTLTLDARFPAVRS